MFIVGGLVSQPHCNSKTKAWTHSVFLNMSGFEMETEIYAMIDIQQCYMYYTVLRMDHCMHTVNLAALLIHQPHSHLPQKSEGEPGRFSHETWMLLTNPPHFHKRSVQGSGRGGGIAMNDVQVPGEDTVVFPSLV